MIDDTDKKEFQQKWNRIQEYMKKIDADGCLLSIDINLYYTTGHIFNGYFYLPMEGSPWVFIKRTTDIDGEHVIPIRKPEQLPDLFVETGLSIPQKLLLETDELSYNEVLRLQRIFKCKEIENASLLIRKVRSIKTKHEIEQIRQSARKHEETYRQIPGCYHPDMTDLTLQHAIEAIMRKNGSLGIFRCFGNNMEIFMGSILAGNNAENPSPYDFALGGSGMDKSFPLGANGTSLTPDITVMIDMAGNYTPYMTDMTRVYSIGNIAEKAYKAHQVSLHIQDEIIHRARPGIVCSELYNIARTIVQKENLSDNFMGTKQQAKFIGHGIGLQINELPVLTPRSNEVLQEGMVFALEPKFVIPGTGAVGIENSFLVTSEGLEKLTLFDEHIIKL